MTRSRFAPTQGPQLLLPPTRITDREKILNAIGALGSGGGTAMHGGIEAAYKLAASTLVAGELNRVIVLSDGDANLGPHSTNELIQTIKKYRGKGITLSTVGFGVGSYRDQLMEQLANHGDGNYSYIDSLSEAKRVFVSGIDGLLDVVARDVKIQGPSTNEKRPPTSNQLRSSADAMPNGRSI